MKWQGVILYTCVLNILVFSSMVGYLDGGIDCEGGISPFFLKIGNCFNYFNTCLMLSRPVPATCTVLSRPVPATCTVLTLVCRKTCCTIAAYWYTCTYDMLYSLSYITESSVMTNGELILNSFPLLHHFHHKSKILTVGADHWMLLPWWWRQQELQHCLCPYFSPFNIHLL